MPNTILLKRGTTEPTAGVLSVGELAIDTTNGNTYTKLDDGTVSLLGSRASKVEIPVRNETGSTIPAGSAVYITGASGNKPLISLAQANAEMTSSKTLGLTTTSILNGHNGYVILFGSLDKIDTLAYNAGQALWLSATVAGGLVTTPPSQPNHSVFIGIVITSANNGKIEVKIANGYELEELHNVSITTPSNGDLLGYDTDGLWKNKTATDWGLATTAFVTNSNPDASTTVKGHIELATDAEARTSTNSTTALTPSSSIWQRMSAAFLELNRSGFTYTAVGTMGTNQFGSLGTRLQLGTAGACSGRLRVFGISQVDQTVSNMSNTFNVINFSKPTYCSGRLYVSSNLTDPNVTAGWYYGKAENTGAGDLNRRGFGWEIIGDATTRYLTLVVHNGTTLTKVTSSHIVIGGFTAGAVFDWDVVSDGNGNVTLYVNGSSVATSALGPTGNGDYSGTRPVIWQEELRATATTSGFDIHFSRGRIYMAL